VAVWIPFLAADLGNFFGGGVSGYLIRRGWPLGAARKALVVFGGFGVCCSFRQFSTVNLYLIKAAFRLATFPTHPFRRSPTSCLPISIGVIPVASVSGLSGTGAGKSNYHRIRIDRALSDARQASGTHSFDPS